MGATEQVDIDRLLCSGVLSTSNAPAHAILGPRTHGSTDSLWDSDVKIFDTPADVSDLLFDTQTDVPALVVEMACWSDPALRFRPNSESIARMWFATVFKPAYQGVRVPGKRPWPEVAASIRSGFGFVEADADAISMCSGINIASTENGGLVVGDLVLDAPFDTVVLDCNDSRVSTLGTICVRARGQAGSSTRAIAQGLAMKWKRVPGKVLSSMVAARMASLNAYELEE